MKLISWNVNGLRSICQKGFLAFAAGEKPDIICLQETKLQDDQVKEEQMVPPGYCAHFSAAEKRGYSGVATFLTRKMDSSVQRQSKAIGSKRFDTEGRFLITRTKNFILYNVYVPSGTMGDERQSFKYKFLDVFSAHLSSLSKADFSKLIICGDFNICHREIDIHHPAEAEKRQLSGFLPEERKWMENFLRLGLVDTFRLCHGDIKGIFSWWTFRAGARQKNLGWRIDYVFVASALAKKVRKAGIMTKVTGSDHCPVMLDISL